MPRQILAFVPLIALSLAFFLTGCQMSSGSTAATGTPLSPEQLPDLRAQYMQANPNVRIGLVTASEPSGHLASVGYARADDFPVGAIVSFETPNHQLIANGHVTASTDDAINVEYLLSGTHLRDPMAGDLAFTFK
jgi:hypothetical protein